MNYQALQLAAEQVIAAIDKTKPSCVSVDVLASIKRQMEFICKHAAAGDNPSAELPAGVKFTYAVLASRELTSPDELTLQAKINEVTRLLIGV
ncbi:hypothetical protein [Rheinheimera aquimaris]|uniref:hypothetical protein n=1 Tax=Rheinheimera aquimaris TaxID=412437 RepID=UPI001E53A5A9|nr:hypothetical protein [Rheinheimera aquimaris]MCD1597485.1 hypothetical protein [Rheinheimera aquimaris]